MSWKKWMVVLVCILAPTGFCGVLSTGPIVVRHLTLPPDPLPDRLPGSEARKSRSQAQDGKGEDLRGGMKDAIKEVVGGLERASKRLDGR